VDRETKGTRVVTVNPENPEAETIEAAAAVLRAGGLVAFPTETVYGLGADATRPGSVLGIFRAKGRPSDNPLIVHIAEPGDLDPLVSEVPPSAKLLRELFWPGPLTLVLPKSDLIPDEVTVGLTTVAVRMPSHPVALALIKQAGAPVAAPSANVSGRPSPTSAAHVIEDLAGRVDLIIDGGDTDVGLESTVLDLTTDPPTLLRPGGVTHEELCQVLGRVAVDAAVLVREGTGALAANRGADALMASQGAGALAAGQAAAASLAGRENLGRADTDGSSRLQTKAPRSPGMKYTHYAPKAPLFLIEGELGLVVEEILHLMHEYKLEGRRVGVLSTAESRGAYPAHVVLELGSRVQPKAVASALFSTLRAFDDHDVDVILAEGIPEDGLGLAVMNRLRKAAGGRVIRV
jgi:L-threonylcarbamoyladenylate synthase